MGDGSFHFGNVPQAHGAALDYLPDIPLTRLFDTKATLSGMQQYQSYTFGWLLSHYLNFAPDRQGQLVAYLKALNGGEDSLTAAKRIFGDLRSPPQEVRRSQRDPFLAFDFKTGQYIQTIVPMRRPTSPHQPMT